MPDVSRSIHSILESVRLSLNIPEAKIVSHFDSMSIFHLVDFFHVM